jgi:hypothetical protein
MGDGLTKPELLQALKEAGYASSAEQLKTYRREGVLWAPRRVWTPGCAGSESRYPDGTLQQLITVREYNERERRYDHLRLNLWWDGHHVETDHIRRTLARFLEDGVADLRVIADKHPDDPVGAAEEVVTHLRGERFTDHRVGKLMLRRLGGTKRTCGRSRTPLRVGVRWGADLGLPVSTSRCRPAAAGADRARNGISARADRGTLRR